MWFSLMFALNHVGKIDYFFWIYVMIDDCLTSQAMNYWIIIVWWEIIIKMDSVPFPHKLYIFAPGKCFKYLNFDMRNCQAKHVISKWVRVMCWYISHNTKSSYVAMVVVVLVRRWKLWWRNLQNMYSRQKHKLISLPLFMQRRMCEQKSIVPMLWEQFIQSVEKIFGQQILLFSHFSVLLLHCFPYCTNLRERNDSIVRSQSKSDNHCHTNSIKRSVKNDFRRKYIEYEKGNGKSWM